MGILAFEPKEPNQKRKLLAFLSNLLGCLLYHFFSSLLGYFFSSLLLGHRFFGHLLYCFFLGCHNIHLLLCRLLFCSLE